MLLNENSHLYHLHEMQYAAIAPLNLLARMSNALHKHPFHPMAYTKVGRHVAAASEVLARVTHRYGKPEFGIIHTHCGGKQITVYEEIVAEKPFCRLLHFKKETKQKQPRLLIVEDDRGLAALLADLFSAEGYAVDVAHGCVAQDRGAGRERARRARRQAATFSGQRGRLAAAARQGLSRPTRNARRTPARTCPGEAFQLRAIGDDMP